MWLLLLILFPLDWKNEIRWYHFKMYFGWIIDNNVEENINFINLKMPLNEFGNSSHINIYNKIDTSLFVQKPYLRTNPKESNIEKEIDLKNQIRTKKLPDPISIGEAVWKNYVDDKFKDPSTIKNTAHIDLNDKNITNAILNQVNQLPQIDSHLTAKLYVDNATDKPSLVRKIWDKDLIVYNLTNINSNTSNTQAVTDNEVITKAHVDQFRQENLSVWFGKEKSR